MQRKRVTIEFEYWENEEDHDLYPYTSNDNIALVLNDPDNCVNSLISLGYDPAAIGAATGTVENIG